MLAHSFGDTVGLAADDKDDALPRVGPLVDVSAVRAEATTIQPRARSGRDSIGQRLGGNTGRRKTAPMAARTTLGLYRSAQFPPAAGRHPPRPPCA